jgi:hypothetical protein
LLTYDWQALPRHFPVLGRAGIWLSSIRLTLPGYIGPNVAGGLLAMLLPFSAVAWGHGVRARDWRWVVFHTLSGGLILLGLILSSSRGAWGRWPLPWPAGGCGGLGACSRDLSRKNRMTGCCVGR